MRELLLASWNPHFTFNLNWLKVTLSIPIPVWRMTMTFYKAHILFVML